MVPSQDRATCRLILPLFFWDGGLNFEPQTKAFDRALLEIFGNIIDGRNNFLQKNLEY